MKSLPSGESVLAAVDSLLLERLKPIIGGAELLEVTSVVDGGPVNRVIEQRIVRVDL